MKFREKRTTRKGLSFLPKKQNAGTAGKYGKPRIKKGTSASTVEAKAQHARSTPSLARASAHAQLEPQHVRLLPEGFHLAVELPGTLLIPILQRGCARHLGPCPRSRTLVLRDEQLKPRHLGLERNILCLLLPKLLAPLPLLILPSDVASA